VQDVPVVAGRVLAGGEVGADPELLEYHRHAERPRHCADRLSTEEASMVKWWNTELCNRVTDRCVQLYGGYGYMREYPVARAWADSRVQSIFGGTTEIQKEIIARNLGL
jgi:alkylation response protein AidB-like acyl-CoA dehydrogenase